MYVLAGGDVCVCVCVCVCGGGGLGAITLCIHPWVGAGKAWGAKRQVTGRSTLELRMKHWHLILFNSDVRALEMMKISLSWQLHYLGKNLQSLANVLTRRIITSCPQEQLRKSLHIFWTNFAKKKFSLWPDPLNITILIPALSTLETSFWRSSSVITAFNTAPWPPKTYIKYKRLSIQYLRTSAPTCVTTL